MAEPQRGLYKRIFLHIFIQNINLLVKIIDYYVIILYLCNDQTIKSKLNSSASRLFAKFPPKTVTRRC
jgi:hypothetical protein